MKIFLVVSTVLTVSTSWAQTSFIAESSKCENGNPLNGQLTTTTEATFTVMSVDGNHVLVRTVDNESTTYSLSPLGVDQETKQTSYLAFAPNGGHFVVIMTSQDAILTILENDRDFQKCKGGLVVVSLTEKASES